MDTGMRDLAQIEEREDGPGRKLATLLMAALATVGLVFAMGVLLGSEDGDAPEATEDPLAALDRAAGLPGEEVAVEEEPPPEVAREELRFPEALADYDRRPEVEAALAAAAAELQHPDTVAAGDLATGRAALPMQDAMHPALPAAVAAGPAGQVLARTVQHDPMVAAALPAEPARPRATAPAGRDGEYTLQVISYQNPTDANVFAEGLRGKGHSAFVVTADIPERGRHWRVRIGPFDTMREAETYRSEFEGSERMNTYVVRRRDGET
jgi:cell division septation protein DedD